MLLYVLMIFVIIVQTMYILLWSRVLSEFFPLKKRKGYKVVPVKSEGLVCILDVFKIRRSSGEETLV